MNKDTCSSIIKNAKNALDAARLAVTAALKQAGITLKEASRALGRNDAYLPQYLFCGSPRRLPKEMRYALAELMGCDQRRFSGFNDFEPQVNAALDNSALVLTKPPGPSFCDPDRTKWQAMADIACITHTNIDFMDNIAIVKGGALNDGEAGNEAGSVDILTMPIEMLRKIPPTPSAKLKLITITGDSMTPALKHGDVVMVDCTQTQPSPPGIFIVDYDVGLVAKQLDLVPATQPQMLRLTLESGIYMNCQRQIDEVHIVGRVVWVARQM